jgi:hypothetical protein
MSFSIRSGSNSLLKISRSEKSRKHESTKTRNRFTRKTVHREINATLTRVTANGFPQLSVPEMFVCGPTLNSSFVLSSFRAFVIYLVGVRPRNKLFAWVRSKAFCLVFQRRVERS